MVASGSAVLRARAASRLAGFPQLKVEATARTVADLLPTVRAARPDLVLLGADALGGELPNLLEQLRAEAPIPVLLLTLAEGDAALLAGLEAGAVDFLHLPPPGAAGWDPGATLELIEEVAARGAAALRRRRRPARLPTAPPSHRDARPAPPRLVVVGASTGGPQAVETILEALPGTLDAVILVALHMPAAFTALYADRLRRRCRLWVEEARDGSPLGRGAALILPGGHQAEVHRGSAGLEVRVRPRSGQERLAPSVDAVMRSAAEAAGALVVGVVLTGMGDDGWRGLEAVLRAGGRTLAEAEETALIFGMPGQAIRRGAAQEVVPLDRIPAALVGLCGTRAPERPR